MLLSDCLGGNAKTLMLVNVAPGESNVDESQSSLAYATRVRSIKNSAVRDEAGREAQRCAGCGGKMRLGGLAGICQEGLTAPCLGSPSMSVSSTFCASRSASFLHACMHACVRACVRACTFM
jgi:Kinesin motor domain